MLPLIHCRKYAFEGFPDRIGILCPFDVIEPVIESHHVGSHIMEQRVNGMQQIPVFRAIGILAQKDLFIFQNPFCQLLPLEPTDLYEIILQYLVYLLLM